MGMRAPARRTTAPRQPALYGQIPCTPCLTANTSCKKPATAAISRAARGTCRAFLSQSSDVDRISAYADELDELAEEMERLADDGQDKRRGRDKSRPH
jgi:hypothetical protein